LLVASGIAFAEVQFPSPQGYINDYAGILSASNKNQLESIAQNLKQNTGAELAVAIVQSVAPLDSKLYAVKLFEKWGIGEKGKDNGVLLLVAIDERRVEIEVGYGLEGVLTDALCGRILDSFAVPNFRRGEMGEGILETAQALAKVIANEEVHFADTSEETGGLGLIPGNLVFPLMALFVVLGIAGLIYKNVWIPTLSAGGVGAMVGYLTDEIAVMIFMAFFFGVFGLIFAVIRKYGFTSGGGGGSSWSSGGGGWSPGGGGFSSGGSSSFGGGSSGGGGAGRGW